MNFVIRVKFTKFELFSDYKVKIVINMKFSGEDSNNTRKTIERG